MEKDKAKVIEIVGTASERAGNLVGTAAALGKRIAGVAAGGASAGKGMLGLAGEDTKPVPEKKSNSTKAVASKSDLASVRRQLAEAEKVKSQLESQIETLQKKNNSLISELEQAVSEVKEITAGEGVARARAAALESELAAAWQELTETRSQAESAQAQLRQKLEKLQLEKDSLKSALQITQSQANGAEVWEDVMKTKAAALESEVTGLRSELARAEISKSDNNAVQAEEQTDFTEAAEELKETATAPVGTDEVESSMESAAGPKDNEMNERTEEQSAEMVVAAKQISNLPLREISSSQTEHKEKADSEPAVKEIEPSMEVTAQGEAIDVNVEEPELKSEARAQPEVDTPHLLWEKFPRNGLISNLYTGLNLKVGAGAEVTAEDVQAADFKNGAERIIFLKALSDFASRDAITRADAAAAIAGIHHELSPGLIITHMADEPSAYVRQECIKVLTALESKEGLGAIEQALADEAASVRLAAVWGLYRLAGTESIPVLTRVLSDKDASVRRRAVTCIGWLGGQISRTDNHYFHQVISALIQCLNDPAVKNAALDTLQTVTGKKMSSPRTSPERLIKQWQKWWKAELLG